MDRARKRTNKLLKDLERRVRSVYKTDPSLLRMQKKYELFMADVADAANEAYLAYKNAPIGDERNKLKKIYVDKVKDLTINNKQYNELVSEFTRIMAVVNQKALDDANAKMEDVYILNYNQVAVDCRKIGINVKDINNG